MCGRSISSNTLAIGTDAWRVIERLKFAGANQLYKKLSECEKKKLPAHGIEPWTSSLINSRNVNTSDAHCHCAIRAGNPVNRSQIAVYVYQV